VIGIDTNVLVRFFVEDDARQTRQAADCLERECSEAEPGLVNLVVLCEFVWVLARNYRMNRAAIADTVERILRTVELAVERADVAAEALRRYRAGGADFADCVIAGVNRRTGCASTRTFDRTAAALPEFRTIGA
jgi:predicted nucleic-acid-binding protein